MTNYRITVSLQYSTIEMTFAALNKNHAKYRMREYLYNTGLVFQDNNITNIEEVI